MMIDPAQLKALVALHAAHNVADRTILYLLASRGLLDAEDVIATFRRQAAEFERSGQLEAAQVHFEIADTLAPFIARTKAQEKSRERRSDDT